MGGSWWLTSRRTLDLVTWLAWWIVGLSVAAFGLIRLGVLPSDLLVFVYGAGLFALCVGMVRRSRVERGMWMLAILLIAFTVFAAGTLSFEVFDALRDIPHRLRRTPTPAGEIVGMACLAAMGWMATYLLVCAAAWNRRLSRPGPRSRPRPPSPPWNGSPVPARLGPGPRGPQTPHTLAAAAKRGVPGEDPRSTVQHR